MDIISDARAAKQLAVAGERKKLQDGIYHRFQSLFAPIYNPLTIRQLYQYDNPHVRSLADGLKLFQSGEHHPNELQQLNAIRQQRERLSTNDSKIEYTVYGPSDEGLTDRVYEGIEDTNPISSLAACSHRAGRLLYSLMHEWDDEVSIELGTSIGISGAYLATAMGSGDLLTIEGSESRAEIARDTFSNLELSNVTVQVDRFQDFLLRDNTDVSLNFAFLDGHHHKEATLRYFDALYEMATDDGALIVFDDINFTSGEMEEAWNLIRSDERVDLTVETHQYGMALVKTGATPKKNLKFLMR